MTLALAQSFDLVTFWVMTRRLGPTAEANPIVADLLEGSGLTAVVVAKVALILLVAALAVAAAAQGRRGVWAMVGGLPLAIAVAAGLIGGITNAATFLG
jgi:hypothetical protein